MSYNILQSCSGIECFIRLGESSPGLSEDVSHCLHPQIALFFVLLLKSFLLQLCSGEYKVREGENGWADFKASDKTITKIACSLCRSYEIASTLKGHTRLSRF